MQPVQPLTPTNITNHIQTSPSKPISPSKGKENNSVNISPEKLMELMSSSFKATSFDSIKTRKANRNLDLLNYILDDDDEIQGLTKTAEKGKQTLGKRTNEEVFDNVFKPAKRFRADIEKKST